MRKIILTLLTFVLSITFYGQSNVQEITGEVKDKESGKFIKDASIELLDFTEKLICILKTDDNGIYKIRLSEEVHYVKAKALGYNEVELSYYINPNKKDGKTEIDFLLIPSDENDVQEITSVKTNVQGYTPTVTAASELPIIYFDHNSSYFNEENKRQLKVIGKYLRENPEVRIRINGYSDKYGSDKYNDWMSERRVNRIAEWLVKKEGVSSSRMQTRYFGKRYISNFDDANQWKNRNCSFEIIK